MQRDFPYNLTVFFPSVWTPMCSTTTMLLCTIIHYIWLIFFSCTETSSLLRQRRVLFLNKSSMSNLCEKSPNVHSCDQPRTRIGNRRLLAIVDQYNILNVEKFVSHEATFSISIFMTLHYYFAYTTDFCLSFFNINTYPGRSREPNCYRIGYHFGNDWVTFR